MDLKAFSILVYTYLMINYGLESVNGTYVWCDFFQPLIGHFVEVDLAGQTKVLSSLLEIAQKSKKNDVKIVNESSFPSHHDPRLSVGGYKSQTKLFDNIQRV